MRWQRNTDVTVRSAVSIATRHQQSSYRLLGPQRSVISMLVRRQIHTQKLWNIKGFFAKIAASNFHPWGFGEKSSFDDDGRLVGLDGAENMNLLTNSDRLLYAS